MSEARIRLSVSQSLAPGQPVALDEAQAHYLGNVMRLGVGAGFLAFNGSDGEWLCRVTALGKRGGVALAEAQVRPQVNPPDLWLVFAPVKKARTDFIVEKAVELGVARILPVQTRHTNSERIRQDRLQAHAREAAEQCGATFVPDVAELLTLDRLLAAWPSGRRLFWADETLAGAGSAPEVVMERGAPSAILIGPEGGFAEGEKARLRGLALVTPLRLGPRILRADTAAVAAITLWQARYGDWA